MPVQQWTNTRHGKDHWRKRTDLMVRKRERVKAERVALTMEALEMLGVPVGSPDPLEPCEILQARRDDWIEEHHLEFAGVDRVFAALDRERTRRSWDFE